MKESRWFDIDTTEYTFTSKVTIPVTIEEGWQKSFEKWSLLSQGCHRGEMSKTTCGLCNIHHNTTMDRKEHCIGCPIYVATGVKYCEALPFYADYVWTKDEKDRIRIAGKVLHALKKIYKQSNNQ